MNGAKGTLTSIDALAKAGKTIEMMDREYEILLRRYFAVSRDWNRLRDIEGNWRRTEKIFIVAGTLVLILALFIGID